MEWLFKTAKNAITPSNSCNCTKLYIFKAKAEVRQLKENESLRELNKCTFFTFALGSMQGDAASVIEAGLSQLFLLKVNKTWFKHYFCEAVQNMTSSNRKSCLLIKSIRSDKIQDPPPLPH